MAGGDRAFPWQPGCGDRLCGPRLPGRRGDPPGGLEAFFPAVGAGVVAACALALGLANGVPVLLQRPGVCEIPICCGYALVMLAIGGILLAMLAPGRRASAWLAAASLLYGPAVASPSPASSARHPRRSAFPRPGPSRAAGRRGLGRRRRSHPSPWRSPGSLPTTRFASEIPSSSGSTTSFWSAAIGVRSRPSASATCPTTCASISWSRSGWRLGSPLSWTSRPGRCPAAMRRSRAPLERS